MQVQHSVARHEKTGLATGCDSSGQRRPARTVAPGRGKLAALWMAFALLGCGQKGPLVLPTPITASPDGAAIAPARAASAPAPRVNP